MSNRSGKGKHPGLFLILGRKLFPCVRYVLMLGVSFLYSSSDWESFHLFLVCVFFKSWKGVGFCQMLFCIYWGWSWRTFILLIWCITLIDFYILIQTFKEKNVISLVFSIGFLFSMLFISTFFSPLLHFFFFFVLVSLLFFFSSFLKFGSLGYWFSTFFSFLM